MFVTDEWIPGYVVMGGVVQGTPVDMLFALELYPTGTLPNVSIVLTPYGTPIIPATGGTVEFGVTITNHVSSSQSFDAWIDITLPNGTVISPLIGPRNLNLYSGGVLERDIALTVPVGDPPGVCFYKGSVGGVSTSGLRRRFVDLHQAASSRGY